jgi:hypothetical protein
MIGPAQEDAEANLHHPWHPKDVEGPLISAFTMEMVCRNRVARNGMSSEFSVFDEM